jgi:hypothetical protein
MVWFINRNHGLYAGLVHQIRRGLEIDPSRESMSTDDFCNGCGSLKGNYQGVRRSYVIFCSKTGLNLPGTLERQDKCKRDNLKEVSHAQESFADCPSEDKRS